MDIQAQHAELIDFHKEMAAQYAEIWTEREHPYRDEAAYAMLEHIGLLHRAAPEDPALDAFLARPVAERHELLAAAGAYMDEQELAARADALLDDFDPEDDTPALADLLLQRDALEEFLLVARSAVDLAELEPGPAREGLAAAVLLADELDDRLLAQPDALLEAWGPVRNLRPLIQTPVDEERQWWFGSREALFARFAQWRRDQFFALEMLAAEAAEAAPSNVIPAVFKHLRTPAARDPWVLAAAAEPGGISVMEVEIEGSPGMHAEVRYDARADTYGVGLRTETGSVPYWAPGGHVLLSGTGLEAEPAVLDEDGQTALALAEDELDLVSAIEVYDEEGAYRGRLEFPEAPTANGKE